MHGDNSEFGKFCNENNFLSQQESHEGQGIYIRNDGLRIEKNIIREIDNLVRDTLEDCEKYVKISEESEIPDSIGSLINNSIFNTIESNSDTAAIKTIKKEILNWNIKFLLIDNSCSSLNDLSAKNWGKFQVNSSQKQLIN